MRDDMRRSVDGVRPRIQKKAEKTPKPIAQPQTPVAESPKVDLAHTTSQPAVARPHSKHEQQQVPQPATQPAVPYPKTRRAWRVPVASLTFVLVLALIGFRAVHASETTKTDLANDASAAKTALEGAKKSLEGADYTAAADQFRIAQSSLKRANQRLSATGQLGGVGWQRGAISSSTDILISAELMMDSAVALSEDASAIQQGIQQNNGDVYTVGTILLNRQPQLSQHLSDLSDRLRLLRYNVGVSEQSGVIGDLAPAVAEIKPQLEDLQQTVNRLSSASDQLPSLLGAEKFKQYLVWFQNPAELRPTGGFIGTYGLFTFEKGTMSEMLVDSIYNPAHQTDVRDQGKPPEPIQRLWEGKEPLWSLQNVNWYPSLEESATRFQKYYERSGGPTTDGVIAITINPVVDILRAVGPIDMPEYGYTLTADNFQVLIQNDQYQKGAAGDADPKKILRDFAPKLVSKINTATAAQKADVAKILAGAVAHKDVTFFFNNEKAQSLVAGTVASGEYSPGPQTIGVVDTNLGGRKSSRDMVVEANQDLELSGTGKANLTLTVKRYHNGETSADANLNYTRIYLPKGAKVTETSGFSDYNPVRVYDEDGFTVVGGWTDTKVYETRTIVVKGHLPNRLELGGTNVLTYLSQPGTAVTRTLKITAPDGYTPVVPGATIDGRSATLTDVASSDVKTRVEFRRQ